MEKIAKEIAHLTRPMKGLKLDPGNLREHDEDGVKAIQESLKRFGQQKAIRVDSKGIVRAGNGLLLAARGLKWTRIAALTLDFKDEKTLEDFAALDNRTAELSTWKTVELGRQLRSMTKEERARMGWGEEAEGIMAAAEMIAKAGTKYSLDNEATQEEGDGIKQLLLMVPSKKWGPFVKALTETAKGMKVDSFSAAVKKLLGVK